MKVLPENILNKMSKEDRDQFALAVGVRSAGLTKEEIYEENYKKQEKHIQNEIAAFLRLKDIPYINPPMHKKSGLPLGWTDFTFAINGKACAVEAKAPGGTLREEQKNLHQTLLKSGWKVAVVYSLAEFIAFFKNHEST